MRLVADAAGLPDALAGARREAAAAFGSDRLLLERAIVRPRHVEIQVLADAHGHVIHLGERDCSVQRRHQKVLEESPSPAVNDALRARMGAAGAAAAQAVGYVGAGTVEFLLDPSGEFYFLEMNTRLQVEHPVTEMVTGLDLVEWQLRVAAGEHLTIGQSAVNINGHAIEARLYAEDPGNDYLPATGVVRRWEPATGEGVRFDAGIVAGSAITPYYDPMIAKVIAHGRNREQARARLLRALKDTTVLGTATNRAMLIAALSAPVFADGDATTAFLDDHPPKPIKTTSIHIAAVATWLYFGRRRAADQRSGGLAGWSSTGAVEFACSLQVDGEAYAVRILEGGGEVTVHVDDTEHTVGFDGSSPVLDGVTVPVRCLEPEAGRIFAAFDDVDFEVLDLNELPPDRTAASGEGVLVAPMHGHVVAVEAAVGEPVKAGQRLVVLEAMKMEHAIVADIDGVLGEIVGVGAQASASQVIARIMLQDNSPHAKGHE
jgi:geranyl-CoA carboxylase alpha subunit